jgi:ABC-type lipoprotein release transport system permease subunit
MLVAAVIACTIPLYNVLVSNVQLQHTLAASSPAGYNLDAFAAYNNHFSDQANLDSEVRGFATQNVGSVTAPAPLHYADSEPVLVQQIGTHKFDVARGDVQAKLRAMDYSFTAKYMKFVSGNAPKPVAEGSEPEAIVLPQMTDCYGTKVGDSITMVAFGSHDTKLTVRVVGIWQPKDANDPFWNGVSFQIDKPCPPNYTILMTFSDFYSGVSKGITGNVVEHWVYYTQLQHISMANIGAVASGLSDFRTHMSQNLPLDLQNVSQSTVATQLDVLIQNVLQQTSLLELPLYFIAAPTIGLALLFIAAIAAMLIEAQAQELATLKSRGLSGLQLLGAFALQGALPAVIALVAAPLLAGLAALALIRGVLPSEVLAQSGISPTYLASIAQPGDVVLAALVASLLGFVALATAAVRAARLDVLAFRREAGRPTRPPLWHRLHLDLVLAVVCALGYIELAQFGNTSTRLALGDLANSPLLLAAPSLLLLAGALLLLRLLPPVARLGAHLASRARGITTQLAFTSIARNPARHARVVLLLALAVGLGLFAVTYDAALALNAQDRASYQAGADARLNLLFQLGSSERQQYESNLAKLSGVTAAAPVYHDQVITSTGAGTGSRALDLLGVDPASFAKVAAASWRDDYGSGASFSDLMGHLADTPGTDKPIIVSDTLASALHLHTGDRLSLQLTGNDFALSPFKIVAVVHDFPTLYATKYPLGFAVANLKNVVEAINQGQTGSEAGPNEYWLSTSQNPSVQNTLFSTLESRRGSLEIASIDTRHNELEEIEANPLNAGMRGLLLSGAAIAALLAIVGILVQSILAARQRTGQFAVLRTLGMARAQLTRLLLSEQLVVYLLGMLGGTAIGIVLATATLPFLQFGDTTLDPSTIGVPPYRLALDLRPVLVFYVALLVAFVLALLLAARYANRLGLGRALRVGED